MAMERPDWASICSAVMTGKSVMVAATITNRARVRMPLSRQMLMGVLLLMLRAAVCSPICVGIILTSLLKPFDQSDRVANMTF